MRLVETKESRIRVLKGFWLISYIQTSYTVAAKESFLFMGSLTMLAFSSLNFNLSDDDNCPSKRINCSKYQEQYSPQGKMGIFLLQHHAQKIKKKMVYKSKVINNLMLLLFLQSIFIRM